MQLELRSRQTEVRPGRPPLLFVHGGFHAAWCFDEHYLDFFAERGWAAHALSLRGHGESEGHDRIRDWTLDDYVNDVTATVTRIGGEAILLGHSMGGAISERCFDTDPRVAGIALLAGSPLRPAPSVIARMLLRNPFALFLGQLTRDPYRLRSAMTPIFFSPDLDERERDAHRARLDLESPLAMAELFSRAPIIRRAGDERPALVVAATDDVSIPMRSHVEASERLGATLRPVPGAHDLMLDPRWREGAEAVEAWLRERFAGRA